MLHDVGGSGVDIFQLPPRLIHALRFWQAHYALLSRERAPAAIYALMEGLVVYVNCVSTLVHRWRWRWIGFGNASAILRRCLWPKTCVVVMVLPRGCIRAGA